jgi:protein-S-isoprenylcysteine O-methyltransferase Ste14
MDQARHFIALIAVISYPPALLYWFLVHPFSRFWKRIGLFPTYAIILTLLVGIAITFCSLREPILAIEYGNRPLLIALAVLLFTAGTAVEIGCRRHLRLSTLVGIPELNPEGSPGTLLRAGLYGRMRHPRYTGAGLGVLATACAANHLATYLIAAVYFPLVYLITVLEERELLERFGDAYREYQETVPRFIPRRFS